MTRPLHRRGGESGHTAGAGGLRRQRAYSSRPGAGSIATAAIDDRPMPKSSFDFENPQSPSRAIPVAHAAREPCGFPRIIVDGPASPKLKEGEVSKHAAAALVTPDKFAKYRLAENDASIEISLKSGGGVRCSASRPTPTRSVATGSAASEVAANFLSGSLGGLRGSSEGHPGPRASLSSLTRGDGNISASRSGDFETRPGRPAWIQPSPPPPPDRSNNEERNDGPLSEEFMDWATSLGQQLVSKGIQANAMALGLASRSMFEGAVAFADRLGDHAMNQRATASASRRRVECRDDCSDPSTSLVACERSSFDSSFRDANRREAAFASEREEECRDDSPDLSTGRTENEPGSADSISRDEDCQATSVASKCEVDCREDSLDFSLCRTASEWRASMGNSLLDEGDSGSPEEDGTAAKATVESQTGSAEYVAKSPVQTIAPRLGIVPVLRSDEEAPTSIFISAPSSNRANEERRKRLMQMLLESGLIPSGQRPADLDVIQLICVDMRVPDECEEEEEDNVGASGSSDGHADIVCLPPTEPKAQSRNGKEGRSEAGDDDNKRFFRKCAIVAKAKSHRDLDEPIAESDVGEGAMHNEDENVAEAEIDRVRRAPAEASNPRSTERKKERLRSSKYGRRRQWFGEDTNVPDDEAEDDGNGIGSLNDVNRERNNVVGEEMQRNDNGQLFCKPDLKRVELAEEKTPPRSNRGNAKYVLRKKEEKNEEAAEEGDKKENGSGRTSSSKHICFVEERTPLRKNRSEANCALKSQTSVEGSNECRLHSMPRDAEGGEKSTATSVSDQDVSMDGSKCDALAEPTRGPVRIKLPESERDTASKIERSKGPRYGRRRVRSRGNSLPNDNKVCLSCTDSSGGSILPYPKGDGRRHLGGSSYIPKDLNHFEPMDPWANRQTQVRDNNKNNIKDLNHFEPMVPWMDPQTQVGGNSNKTEGSDLVEKLQQGVKAEKAGAQQKKDEDDKHKKHGIHEQKKNEDGDGGNNVGNDAGGCIPSSPSDLLRLDSADERTPSEGHCRCPEHERANRFAEQPSKEGDLGFIVKHLIATKAKVMKGQSVEEFRRNEAEPTSVHDCLEKSMHDERTNVQVGALEEKTPLRSNCRRAKRKDASADQKKSESIPELAIAGNFEPESAASWEGNENAQPNRGVNAIQAMYDTSSGSARARGLQCAERKDERFKTARHRRRRGRLIGASSTKDKQLRGDPGLGDPSPPPTLLDSAVSQTGSSVVGDRPLQCDSSNPAAYHEGLDEVGEGEKHTSLNRLRSNVKGRFDSRSMRDALSRRDGIGTSECRLQCECIDPSPSTQSDNGPCKVGEENSNGRKREMLLRLRSKMGDRFPLRSPTEGVAASPAASESDGMCKVDELGRKHSRLLRLQSKMGDRFRVRSTGRDAMSPAASDCQPRDVSERPRVALSTDNGGRLPPKTDHASRGVMRLGQQNSVDSESHTPAAPPVEVQLEGRASGSECSKGARFGKPRNERRGKLAPPPPPAQAKPLAMRTDCDCKFSSLAAPARSEDESNGRKDASLQRMRDKRRFRFQERSSTNRGPFLVTGDGVGSQNCDLMGAALPLQERKKNDINCQTSDTASAHHSDIGERRLSQRRKRFQKSLINSNAASPTAAAASFEHNDGPASPQSREEEGNDSPTSHGPSASPNNVALGHAEIESNLKRLKQLKNYRKSAPKDTDPIRSEHTDSISESSTRECTGGLLNEGGTVGAYWIGTRSHRMAKNRRGVKLHKRSSYNHKRSTESKESTRDVGDDSIKRETAVLTSICPNEGTKGAGTDNAVTRSANLQEIASCERRCESMSARAALSAVNNPMGSGTANRWNGDGTTRRTPNHLSAKAQGGSRPRGGGGKKRVWRLPASAWAGDTDDTIAPIVARNDADVPSVHT